MESSLDLDVPGKRGFWGEKSVSDKIQFGASIVFALASVLFAFASAVVAYNSYTLNKSVRSQETARQILNDRSNSVDGTNIGPLIELALRGSLSEKRRALAVLLRLSPRIALIVSSVLADDDSLTLPERDLGTSMNGLANSRELRVDFLRDLKIARDLTRNTLFEEACEIFRTIRIPTDVTEASLVRLDRANTAALRCDGSAKDGAQESIQAFKAVRVP